MASDKQIDANRRNAQRSTGPKSRLGKQRTSKNAFRHGLSVPLSGAVHDNQVEQLTREIADGSEDDDKLALARTAAKATIEIQRIRNYKHRTIERALALGGLECPTSFSSSIQEVRWLIRMDLFCMGKSRSRPLHPVSPDPLKSMPLQEPQRTAEAMRRSLPVLLLLERYEARSESRRNRALRAMAKL